MFKNAFKYVTRKSAKSVILFLVVLIMSSLCLVGLSIKDATNKEVSFLKTDIVAGAKPE